MAERRANAEPDGVACGIAREVVSVAHAKASPPQVKGTDGGKTVLSHGLKKIWEDVSEESHQLTTEC